MLGLLSLVLVDYMQLEIPKIYKTLLLGINSGYIDEAKTVAFDLNAKIVENALS